MINDLPNQKVNRHTKIWFEGSDTWKTIEDYKSIIPDKIYSKIPPPIITSMSSGESRSEVLKKKISNQTSIKPKLLSEVSNQSLDLKNKKLKFVMSLLSVFIVVTFLLYFLLPYSLVDFRESVKMKRNHIAQFGHSKTETCDFMQFPDYISESKLVQTKGNDTPLYHYSKSKIRDEIRGLEMVRLYDAFLNDDSEMLKSKRLQEWEIEDIYNNLQCMYKNRAMGTIEYYREIFLPPSIALSFFITSIIAVIMFKKQKK